MKKLLPFFLLLLSFRISASEPFVTSLIRNVNSAGSDTARINALNALGRQYIIENEYILADSVLQLALGQAEAVKFSNGQMSILINMGVLYWYQDKYPQALEHYFRSLRLAEQYNNKNAIGRCYANIGLVYASQGDKPKALEYYQKALNLKVEINDKKASAIIMGNIGDIHKSAGDYNKALEYFLRAQRMSAELKEDALVAYFQACAGSAYELKGELPKAYEAYRQALEVAVRTSDKVMVSANNISLGSLYLSEKKYDEAEKHLHEGLELAEAIGDLNNKRDAHKKLSELYRAREKWQLALSNYKDFITLQDSIFNDENTRKTIQSEMNFEFDKKQAAEKAVQAEKDAITAEEMRQRKMQRNYIVAGFFLVLLIAIFIFRGYRQKQRSSAIIEQQTQEVEHQKEIIEEKNKEITDSIRYAKHLQEAILPPQKLIDTHLPENFVLYLPKDIVAGDFYWLEKINVESGERSVNQSGPAPLTSKSLTLLAVADCTGHGVPGAMVSVVCSNALNRSVKEFGITEPGKILDKTRELVLETFARSDQEVKDGMDISLCAIREDGSLQWAGAYNPLWYVRDGELKELIADKQPIGKTDDPYLFTTHTLQLKKGDSIYLFSDGYPDQFGGEKGKKFKYKPLKEILKDNADLSMEQQKKKLEETFNKWRGKLEQVDDVCIVGIRL